jgi:hypothetical protein
MYDKKSDPVLTEYDITINGIHQENMFKGTIAVCIIYAVFAFILICAAYLSDNIRELLFDKFLPFTLIYIVGTIIIIMIFIYFVLSFEPKKVDINKIDENISCPDYWKLEILDDNVIEKSFDIKNFNKKLFKYRCVMDDKIFNKASIYKQDKKTLTPEQYRLGNKPGFIGSLNSDEIDNEVTTNYNDLYNSGKLNELNNFINKDNDKYYYLYKNVNAYNNYNLNYANKANISSNIIDDLKQSALIMNNYQIDSITDFTKYTDLTNSGGINVFDNSPTALQNRLTSNYYNSPPILTWATSNARNAGYGSVAYRNIALANDNIAIKTYTATVYDWSTMELPTTGGIVYVFDKSIISGVNFMPLGTIEQEPILFKGSTSITIPASLFNEKFTFKNYYFDETYVTAQTFTNFQSNEVIQTLKRGPKVRLFHKTERQPEIRKEDLANENIPLTCSAVYPSFLASKEDKYSENNTLRCAYSKICNIPWSDLHCSDINLAKYPSS